MLWVAHARDGAPHPVRVMPLSAAAPRLDAASYGDKEGPEMDGHTAARDRVRATILPVAILAVLLLSGCGGGGGNLPSPTRTLPSVSVSVPTRPATTEAPETPTPSEAPSETQEPTPTPKPTPTPRPTKSVVVTQTVTPTPTQEPTPTETPTPTPTAAAAPAATDTAEGGLPSWLWWLLAVVLTGLVAYLILRARRRSAWDAEAADAELEVGWLARELLPQLQQAGTTQALAGGWQVSSARAGALEDRLTGLQSSAPDEPRATRARDLRDAVRAARADIESQMSSGDHASTPVVLAGSIARLQELLNPPPPAM